MSTPAPTPARDPLARRFRAVQAVRELAAARSGLTPCACGRGYDDTPGGRHAHRLTLGHTPQREAVWP